MARITRGQLISLVYHNYFSYPLTRQELVRWQAGKTFNLKKQPPIYSSGGFYYLKGRRSLIGKRLARSRHSQKKLIIARRAAKTLKLIPAIKFIGITGSLAMQNCRKDSDIDLLIITRKGTLWTTRFLSYFLLAFSRQSVRRPGNKSERDKLCLNIWLDESDLYFTEHNIYTAHELAQIVPLFNKDKTYERLLYINRWIGDYWPNAISKNRFVTSWAHPKNSGFIHNTLYLILYTFIEPAAYFLQRFYMRAKITNEYVTPTRALFHPINLSGKVNTYLMSVGIRNIIK